MKYRLRIQWLCSYLVVLIKNLNPFFPPSASLYVLCINRYLKNRYQSRLCYFFMPKGGGYQLFAILAHLMVWHTPKWVIAAQYNDWQADQGDGMCQRLCEGSILRRSLLAKWSWVASLRGNPDCPAHPLTLTIMNNYCLKLGAGVYKLIFIPCEKMRENTHFSFSNSFLFSYI